MQNLKRFTLPALLLLTFTVAQLKAQNYLGLTQSNYSGIHAMYANPASMVDRRLQMDMHLFTMGIFAGNNYIKASIVEGLTEVYTERNKNAFFNLDFRGPSAFYSFNENTGLGRISRFSVGVTSRYRTALSISDASRRTAALAYNGIKDTTLQNITFADPSFNFNLMTWGEMGIAIGAQIHNHEDVVVNAAIHLKKLYGYGAGFVHSYNSRFRVINHDTIIVNKMVGDYGHAASNFFRADGEFGLDYDSTKVLGTGLGADIGFVYEFRPEIYELSYDRRLSNDENKYLLRLGVALLDIGGINFNKDAFRYSYTGDNYFTRKEIDSLDNPYDFDTLAQRKYKRQSSDNSFTMKLPTAFALNADYNYNSTLYLNVGLLYGFRHSSNPGIKQNTYMSIIPRYETGGFELAFPIAFRELSATQAGFMVRIGGFAIGSDSALSILFGQVNAADIYFSFRIPFFRR